MMDIKCYKGIHCIASHCGHCYELNAVIRKILTYSTNNSWKLVDNKCKITLVIIYLEVLLLNKICIQCILVGNPLIAKCGSVVTTEFSLLLLGSYF